MVPGIKALFSKENILYMRVLHIICIYIYINLIYKSNSCGIIKLIIIICISGHSSIDFKHFVIRTGRVAISSGCLSVYTQHTCVQVRTGCLETITIYFNNGYNSIQ